MSESKRKVHPVSEAGFGIGKSELYDRARPSYEPEVLSYIRQAVAKSEGLRVVELGCGTGLFTRALLTHPEWSMSVAEMRCVDPNEGMRATFAEKITDPRVGLFNGTFDSTGVPNGWADLVASATAFHWCSDLDETIVELVRITTPGATMCFLWNNNDTDKAAWTKEIMDDIVLPYHVGIVSQSENFTAWRRIFDLPLYKQTFEQPEEKDIKFTIPATLDSIALLAFSRSGIAVQPPDEKEKIRRRIGEVIARGEGLVWIDKEKGVFEYPLKTNVVVMQRKSS